MKKLTKLEAIRGFASVYVVLHHVFGKGLIIAGKDFSFLFRFGQESVILFFLLSGFVIQYSFSLSKDKSFRSFFLKRFLRIYIPLLLVFIANYALYSFNNKTLIALDWWNLAGNILMLQDVSFLKPHVICEPFLGNTPLWSLSYEWWFYMMFFVLITMFKEKASLIVYCAGTIATITYLFYPFFINREIMYFIIWWIGADMARIFITKKKITIQSITVPIVFLVANVLLLVLNVKLNNINSTIGVSPFLELRHFAFAFVAILIAVVWQSMKWFGFSKTLGLFERIAPVSFALYISHWFLIAKATYLNNIIHSYYLRLAIYTIMCLLFCYVVERIIYVRLNNYVRTRMAANKISKQQKVLAV